MTEVQRPQILSPQRRLSKYTILLCYYFDQGAADRRLRMISLNLDLVLRYPDFEYYCTLLTLASRCSAVDRRLKMTCSNLDLGLSYPEIVTMCDSDLP